MMVKLFVLALSANLCFAQNMEFKRASGPNIQRDCNLKDNSCIQNLLCRDKKYNNNNEAPECYQVPETKHEQSYYNLTIVDRTTDICGLDNCSISEFFLNKKTGNKVVALTCHNINIAFDRCAYQHVPLMEDEEICFKVSATFPEITLSTVLHKSRGYDLCTAHTASYFLAPKVELETKGKKVRDFVNRNLSPPGVFTRVILLKIGRNMFLKYFNSVFCHFGCH